MRLFHVSEESDINLFIPRIPYRKDIDNSKGLVWAITEKCLPNFLTPRNCPRVTYYSTNKSSIEDKESLFSLSSCPHVVAIEYEWFKTMQNTTLYLYEFNTSNFHLQDEIAGYYVSENTEVPINKFIITDLFEELFKRNVELRVINNLCELSDRVKKSSLNWSMCRMGNAKNEQN